MDGKRTLKAVARIRSDYPTKFGIPRQSGLAPHQMSRVVFEPEFRDENALRGISQYTHLWLLWGFSALPEREGWSPTVKPPKLGGNERVGVFATRSPNRPNPIGLSCVKLEAVEKREGEGTVLVVSGADLMDGTPVWDVKPYLPYTDCRPEAEGGFGEAHAGDRLEVVFPPELLERIPEDGREALLEALRLDPRPGYKADPGEPFGFAWRELDIRFRVDGGVLAVTDVQPRGAARVKE